MGWIKQALFGISPDEARVSRRGFEVGDHTVRARIEQIGETFVEGYDAALLDDEPARLAERLNRVEAERRGFAYEGAAMGMMVSDFVSPWRKSRWQAFLDGPGVEHAYMLHVGAGWALARLPLSPERSIKGMDSLLRWLVLDGYGFHQGYFRWTRFVAKQEEPKRLFGYGRCAFDQGLGRSLWFVQGADPVRIAAAIASFSDLRQGHLWSGVGLAATYAGGVERSKLEILRGIAGAFLPQLAQGAAFAAKARQRAGNPAAHSDSACEVLCGLSAEEAAAITDGALKELPVDGGTPAYEIWRRRIRAHFEKN